MCLDVVTGVVAELAMLEVVELWGSAVVVRTEPLNDVGHSSRVMADARVGSTRAKEAKASIAESD